MVPYCDDNETTNVIGWKAEWSIKWENAHDWPMAETKQLHQLTIYRYLCLLSLNNMFITIQQ